MIQEIRLKNSVTFKKLKWLELMLLLLFKKFRMLKQLFQKWMERKLMDLNQLLKLLEKERKLMDHNLMIFVEAVTKKGIGKIVVLIEDQGIEDHLLRDLDQDQNHQEEIDQDDTNINEIKREEDQALHRAIRVAAEVDLQAAVRVDLKERKNKSAASTIAKKINRKKNRLIRMRIQTKIIHNRSDRTGNDTYIMNIFYEHTHIYDDHIMTYHIHFIQYHAINLYKSLYQISISHFQFLLKTNSFQSSSSSLIFLQKSQG